LKFVVAFYGFGKSFLVKVYIFFTILKMKERTTFRKFPEYLRTRLRYNSLSPFLKEEPTPPVSENNL